MIYENSKIKSFTDLKAWQEGHQLVILIYYSLIDQMRRAASSVTSNIAEGFGRQTYKEKVQYYYQAQDSLIELKNQILIAKDVGYLPLSEFKKLAEQANITHRLLQGLISKSKTYLK